MYVISSSIKIIPLILGYFLSLLFFFNSQSFFIYWLFLEVNLLIFLVILYISSSSNLYDARRQQGIYYFCIQSLGSFLFLLSIFSNFSTQFHYRCEFLLIFSILIKIGIFPLHSWAYKISAGIRIVPFFILITTQKIPIFIILFSCNRILVIRILIINIIMGAIYTYFRERIEYLLLSSSIYITIWFYIIFYASSLMFFIIFIFYRIYLWFLLINSSSPWGYLSTNALIFARFIMGMPPFRVFFLKFYSFSSIFSLISPFYIVLCWLVAFFSLIRYLKFFLIRSFSYSFNSNTVKTRYQYTFFFFLFIRRLLLFI